MVVWLDFAKDVVCQRHGMVARNVRRGCSDHQRVEVVLLVAADVTRLCIDT
jgi:hypothetical protein